MPLAANLRLGIYRDAVGRFVIEAEATGGGPVVIEFLLAGRSLAAGDEISDGGIGEGIAQAVLGC